MNRPNLLWVGYAELWRCGCHREDLADNDIEVDLMRQGYWIDPKSKTATILALRGCSLINRNPDSWQNLSSVLGKNILGPKCSGQ